jgi:thiol-disulfide isomerase/thioredoxin
MYDRPFDSRGTMNRKYASSVIVAIGVTFGWAKADPMNSGPLTQASPSAPNASGPAKESAKRPVAPDFEARDLDGKKIKLSDFRGKVVVIDFWATWCGPCVRGMPVSVAVTKEYGDRVVFLPVDVDDRESAEKVKAFAAKKGWSFPLYLGGKAVGAKYGVSGIPHTVIVAADGTVTAKHVGFSSESDWKESLSKDINAALAIK